MKPTLPPLLVLALAFPAFAATGQPVDVALPGALLQLQLPAEWALQQRGWDDAIDLRIAPREKGDFVILLTVMRLPPGSPIANATDAKNAVIAQGEAALPGALQERLELTEIRPARGVGYLYHLTDRNPERGPGDFREAHQGAFLLGSYFVPVTILTHPGDTENVQQAIALLRTLNVKPVLGR